MPTVAALRTSRAVSRARETAWRPPHCTAVRVVGQVSAAAKAILVHLLQGRLRVTAPTWNKFIVFSSPSDGSVPHRTLSLHSPDSDSTCQAPPRHYDKWTCPPNSIPPISALATDSLRN